LPTGQLIRPFRAGRGLIEDGRAFPTRCPGTGPRRPAVPPQTRR